MQTTQARRISTTDTAKLIRAALKQKFPGVTFAIRSKSYSGGSSIRVEWLDGPTTKNVEAVAGRFSGANFDGMIDLKSYHDTLLNGERVHFGADYVFCTRSYTDAAIAAIKAKIDRKFGIDWTINGYFENTGTRGYGQDLFHGQAQEMTLPIAAAGAGAGRYA